MSSSNKKKIMKCHHCGLKMTSEEVEQVLKIKKDVKCPRCQKAEVKNYIEVEK